jgi:hypothetical protein
MTYLYLLQNFTTVIQKNGGIVAHIKIVPTLLITDFDIKLVGNKTLEYLNGNM